MGIGPGGNREIVLELLLVAVIDELNARVQLLDLNAGEGGHPGPPTRSLVAYEIVDLAAQFSFPAHGRLRIGVEEFETGGDGSQRVGAQLLMPAGSGALRGRTRLEKRELE